MSNIIQHTIYQRTSVMNFIFVGVVGFSLFWDFFCILLRTQAKTGNKDLTLTEYFVVFFLSPQFTATKRRLGLGKFG